MFQDCCRRKRKNDSSLQMSSVSAAVLCFENDATVLQSKQESDVDGALISEATALKPQLIFAPLTASLLRTPNFFTKLFSMYLHFQCTLRSILDLYEIIPVDKLPRMCVYMYVYAIV